MKISVNVRLTTGHNSGIAHYINSLYLNWPNKENLVLLRPNIAKAQGFFKSFWFDNFAVGALAEGNIFHGPANILPIFKKQGIKYVVTIHDLAFLTVPQSCSFIFRKYYEWAVHRSVNQADMIIADSESTMRDLQKFYKISETKITNIYPGVDEVFFSRKRNEPLIKGKYIFSVATHAKRKNIFLIFQLLIEDPFLKDFKFIISGPIPRTTVPKQLKGRVIFTGFVGQNKLINFYQHAQFFIYPSLYEGFGFPVLEAMACYCPVLVSDTSSLKELVPNSHFRFDPYNLHSIVNRTRYLLELTPKQRTDILKKNYYWAGKFRWNKTVKKTMSVFREII